MTDRRLVYVVATARLGSITAAAEQVGVTQPAITKSLGDLERQLGYQIFNRTALGVILTDEGTQFVERAARILDETQELLRGSLPGSDPYKGVLKIGVCPASIESLLLEPLTKLTARHPDLQLNIAGSSFERTVQQLRSGAIDVALGYDAAFEDHPDFQRRLLPAMATTFFVRQGHPILDSSDVSTAKLAEYKIISPTDSRPYDSLLRSIYENAGIEAQTRLHFIDYFPIVVRLVSNSNAIGVVSVDYTRTEEFKRRFVRVPFWESRPLLPVCIATRSRWPARLAVRAFIKACTEDFRPSEQSAQP